jgi:hypothetical protein
MINDSLNVNVKTVAAFLQTLFHEEPTKRGYYYHLHKQCPRPECWLAAAIKTLVGMHQTKTVQNPGRYFYDCCVRLHGDATLPPVEAELRAEFQTRHPGISPTSPPAGPDQYAAFVARRTQGLKAASAAKGA